MTQQQINKYFELNILPKLKKEGVRIDEPLIRFEYNMYLDSLHRDGLISDRQVNTMVIPDKFLK